MDEAFATWWCEHVGHPPLPDEAELVARCAAYFEAGMSREVTPIYGDGMRQRDVPPLAKEAFFAGVLWQASVTL